MKASGQQRHERPPRLRRQVLAWLLACAMVPLVVMALQGYHCARSAVIALETIHLQSVLQGRKARITDWFEERKADMETLSASIRTWQEPVNSAGPTTAAGTAKGCSLLDRVQAGKPAFQSIAVYDESWRRVATATSSVHADSELVPGDIRDRLEKATGVVVTQPHRHGSGRIDIHLGVPIRGDDNETTGYLAAAVLLSERLYPILEDNSGLRNSTKTYIVSPNGKLFSGPRPHIEVLSRGIDFPDGFLHDPGRGVTPYRDCCGRKVLGMASPIPDLGWVLVAEVDQAEALAWLLALRLRALFTGVIVFGAVLLFGIHGSRVVAQPFRELQAVAQRILEGSHTERVPAMRSAEADAVGHTLNAMLDELAVHARELANAGALAAVGKLSSSVVHEMRNPLSSIKLNLEAMRDGFDQKSEDRELADIALKEAVRVEGMLNDLLAYGKPLDLAPASVPLARLLRRVAEHAGAICRKHGIRLVTEWHAAESLSVSVDEEQMLRALSNLTDNAIQFAPEGSSVLIEVTAPGDALNLVEIAVKDEGPGMRPDSIERVFEPFFTTRECGTGLGLANARKIIECHGGTVSAANRPGGGAVVTVQIPAAQRKTPGTHASDAE